MTAIEKLQKQFEEIETIKKHIINTQLNTLAGATKLGKKWNCHVYDAAEKEARQIWFASQK